MKNVVQTVLGIAGKSPVLAPVVRRMLSATVNVIYYHFATDKPAPHYVDSYTGCTLKHLDRDLSTLSDHFRFVTLEEILEFNRGSIESEDRPLMAVTFDDGFDLINSGVADILERHHVSATAFVMTSCIDNANLMWCHKLSATRALVGSDLITRRFNELALKTKLFNTIRTANELFPTAFHIWPMDRKEDLVDEIWNTCGMPLLEEYLRQHSPYSSWDGLRQWMERGHSVGLHTATHPVCSRLPPTFVETEIRGPAELLKQRLKIKEVALAYPFGSRLPQKIEEELYLDKTINCALGIRGFSKRNTAPFRLERLGVEYNDLHYRVFGKPLVRAFRNR